MSELILRSGKKAGRRIPLSVGDVVIGRDDGCRIRLNSTDVSRQHCRLRCTEGSVVVADLGSRNGTFINEIRVTSPTKLGPGDILRVGPFVFQTPKTAGERNIESDISGWLTVEGSVAGPPADAKNDTTYVPDVNDREADAPVEESDSGPATALAPSTQREDSVNQNDPVIQQASEIIQDYWQRRKSGF